MAWKPKEKRLTAEEAIALAKKELAPYWHNSPPLIAGVRAAGTVTAHALDPEFNTRPALLVFLDPTDFNGVHALSCAREWQRRYSPHGIQVLVVLRASYDFVKNRDWVEELMRRQQLTGPLVVDVDDLLRQAFRAGESCRSQLVLGSRLLFETPEGEWMNGGEARIQLLLRETDPGLPLFAPLDRAAFGSGHHSSIEFGARKQGHFPAPGFKAPAGGGSAVARFVESGSAEFTIHGVWAQDGEKIATSDPGAWLRFRAPSPRVNVVASPLTNTAEPARILVEAAGAPLYDEIAGESIGRDDEGEAVLRLQGVGIHQAVQDLPEKDREITLRFPQADKVPVCLYGVRFGQ